MTPLLKSIALLGLALVCGCGGAAEVAENDAQNATAAHPVNQPFPSVAGNQIDVSLTPPDGADRAPGCDASQTELEIFYGDDNNFFGGAASIDIFSRTTDASGKTTTVTDKVKGSLSAYFVVHCFDPKVQLKTVEFSFTDPATHKSDGSESYVVDLTNAGLSDRSAERDTIVGNHVNVDVIIHPASNANCASPLLEVAYQDRKSFFGRQKGLNMFFKINSKNGASRSRSVNLVPSGHANTYESVRLCIDWDDSAASLELAFSDPTRHTWDSNNSHNYVFFK